MIKKKSVLVVDDDNIAHFLTKRVLATLGWVSKIDGVYNGKEAIEFFERCCLGVTQAPDIILLDLHMPVMGGLEFLEKLRAMECVKKIDLMIAVLSSSSCPDDRARLARMGISHFIEKPISADKISLLLRGSGKISIL